jgi:hypothetical protein
MLAVAFVPRQAMSKTLRLALPRSFAEDGTAETKVRGASWIFAIERKGC